MFQYCSCAVDYLGPNHVKVFMSAFHVDISAFDGPSVVRIVRVRTFLLKT